MSGASAPSALPVISLIDSPGFAPAQGDDERLLFRWARLS